MYIEKERIAIERLKAFDPQNGYYLAYSGGKDSDCIKILAYLAGVKFEAVHNLTTVDAPETVRYIKSQEDVRIDYPELSMWQLIVKKGIPPTRLIRYCCSELKERGGRGKVAVTGVRWAESAKRREWYDIFASYTYETLRQCLLGCSDITVEFRNDFMEFLFNLP